MSKVVRELFIIILLCMIVIFTIGLLFYDCIPHKNEKIQSIEYVADENVTNTIEQIEVNGGSDTTKDKEDSLLKSYSIGKDDLTEFASENSYETGKKDPFAEYSNTVEEEVIKTVTSVNPTNNVQTNNKVEKTKNTISNTSVANEENKLQNTTKEKVKESSEGKYTEKKNSK